MSDSSMKIRLDPFGATSIENYEYLYEEFGIQPFKPLIPKIQDTTAAMGRVVFGHRDLNRVLKDMNEHEDYAVMSGIKPTGEFHPGTLMTAREVIYFSS